MSHHHESSRSGIDGRTDLLVLRRQIIRLKDEVGSLHRRLIETRYSPGQARIPAGNSGGGRWTSGQGGGGSGSVGDAGGGFGEGGGFVVDAGGEEAWAFYEESFDADGALSQRTVVNRDGSTIQSDYDTADRAGFDERHVVTLDSGAKTTFETTDRTQTIRAGGPDGAVLSRTLWTQDGPEADATVQPALAPLAAPVVAGAILFGWFSSRNGIDGQQAVMGFNGRDYRPGETGKFDLGMVLQLSEAEVENACRRWPDVRIFADRAASAAGPANQFPSAAAYGTDVHMRFKSYVDELRDPNFKAERSFLKEQAEAQYGREVPYGYPGSIRVDGYELIPADGTLCIYDLKTGKAVVKRSRADILAEAAKAGFRDIRRVIVTEVKPRS